MANHQLFTILLLPVLGMLILLTIREKKTKIIRTVSAIVTGLQLWIILQLFFAFDKSASYLQFVDHFSWINLLSIDFIIGLNGINLPFLILSGLIFFLTVFIAWKLEEHPKSFYVLLMALNSGISGLFMAFDLFLFLLFFGITLFSLFLLINLFTDRSDTNSVIQYGIFALISFSLVTIGILLVTINNPLSTFNLSTLANNLSPSPGVQIAGFLILLSGFLFLSPILPFHSWLIPIVNNINAPIAILILALFTKISIFGILHIILPLFPNMARDLALIFGIIGLINILYFAFCTFSYKQFRKIISYFTGYQNAIIFMGLSAILAIRQNTTSAAVTGLNGVILQVIGASLVIIVLILLPKLISESASRDTNNLAGQWSIKFAVTLTLLAAIGIPGYLNFIAQFFCTLAVFQTTSTRILTIIALVGPLFIGVKFFKIIRGTITGNSEVEYNLNTNGSNEYLITAALLILLILLGLFPGIILQTINQSVQYLVNHLVSI